MKVRTLAELSGISFLRVKPHLALAKSIDAHPVIAAYRAVSISATAAVVRQSPFYVCLTLAANIRCGAHTLAAHQGSSATALVAVFLFVIRAATVT